MTNPLLIKFAACTIVPWKLPRRNAVAFIWVAANGEVLENIDDKKQAYDVMNTVKFMYLNCRLLLLATASAALITARIVKYTEIEKGWLNSARTKKCVYIY